MLLCVYAVAVFSYVVSQPDIGIRCALTPTVNHLFPEYLHSSEAEALPELREWTIVQIGNRRIETWPQFLRAPRQIAQEAIEAEGTEALRDPNFTHVLSEGKEWVRVQFREPGSERRPDEAGGSATPSGRGSVSLEVRLTPQRD